MSKGDNAGGAGNIDAPVTRNGIEARDKAVREAVGELAFPLERPDGLTKAEVEERSKAVEDAVKAIDWTPPEHDEKAARREIEERNAAVEKAVKAIK